MAYTWRVPEVSCSAKEAAEEIERVILRPGAPPGFVLCEAFVAILVVDFAGFGVGEGFVGFGYLYEALGGGVISTLLVALVSIVGFLIPVHLERDWGRRTGSYQGDISCSAFDTPS